MYFIDPTKLGSYPVAALQLKECLDFLKLIDIIAAKRKCNREGKHTCRNLKKKMGVETFKSTCAH